MSKFICHRFQGCNKDLVKHLWRSLFAKIITGFKSLTSCAKTSNMDASQSLTSLASKFRALIYFEDFFFLCCFRFYFILSPSKYSLFPFKSELYLFFKVNTAKKPISSSPDKVEKLSKSKGSNACL